MPPLPDHLTPENWVRQLFSAKAARDGGVVRRQLRDVERIVGLDRFQSELRHRGFRAAINGSQIVVFCNRAPVCVLQ